MNPTSNRIFGDQADQLRRLMRGEANEHRHASRPRTVVVAGGKGGVGTTTISVNLSVAAAVSGKRCVLVDGHFGRSDVAAFCATREGYTITDVLSGRRTLCKALQPGPAGVRVLPGAWAAAQVTDCAPAAQERLLGELSRLDACDLVVIDAGNGINQVVLRFCAAADETLIVTSPDAQSVMGAYAALKTLRSSLPSASVSFLINLASVGQAGETQARLITACRRFLAWEPPCLGHLDIAETVAAAGRARSPLVLTAPRSLQARQITQWATTLLSRVTGDSNKLRKLLQVAPSR